MMWVCDYDHNPVCYDAMKCPVCELQKQLDEKLEEENQELEDQVKELEAQLEDLEIKASDRLNEA